MLNVADIIEDARLSTGAPQNSSHLDDLKLIRFLNRVYHDVENAITNRINSDYFKKTFTSDLYEGISKYRIRDNVVSFKDIHEVAIKTQVDGDYLVILEKEKEMTPYRDEDRNYGRYYDIVGENIELYPTPKESISSGLAITVTINLPDLTVNSGANDVFLGYSELSSYDNVLIEGLRFWIFRIMEKTNEAQVAEQSYKNALNQMLTDVAVRSDEYFEVDYLSHIPSN